METINVTTLLNSSVSYNFTRFEKFSADDENWNFQTRKIFLSALN